MDKKTLESASKIAEAAATLVEAFHQAGFTRSESIQMACALLSKSDVNIAAMGEFASGTAMH